MNPRILRPVLLLPSLLFALAGCNLAPKYRAPAVSTPAAFKETPPAGAEGWQPAQPLDAVVRGPWWRLFGDAQLDRLEAAVRISNQTIQAAVANYHNARALTAEARAELFPLVTASPAVTRSRASATGVNAPSRTTGQTTNDFTLPIDASYTVDLWGRLRNTAAADAADATAAAADVASALLSTQAQLAEDYFEVRALDAERKVFDDTVAAYRQQLQLTRTLFQTGIDSDEDIANAQTQLDTVIAQSTDLGVARAQYEHAIAVLIGVPPSEFSLPPAPFAPTPPSFPLAVPSTLLERRPDIAAAERQVAAANASIGVARAAYFPSLTLSASAGFESSSLSRWLEWPSRIWSLGADADQTLFAAGALSAVTDQAWAQYDQAVANYRQTVLSAFQAVEDDLAALRILTREASEEETAVGSAQHLVDLALTRYRSGIDSYLNVVTSEAALLSDRQTELQVQLRLMNASVALVTAVGGGWERSQLSGLEDNLSRRGNQISAMP